MTPDEVEDVVVTLDDALDALGSTVKRLTELLADLGDTLTDLDAELEKGSGTWPAVWPTRN
jgi:hypothetical protein